MGVESCHPNYCQPPKHHHLKKLIDNDRSEEFRRVVQPSTTSTAKTQVLAEKSICCHISGDEFIRLEILQSAAYHAQFADDDPRRSTLAAGAN